MFKILRLLKPYIFVLIILVILVTIQSLVNLQLPSYMANIINDGILQSNNNAIVNNGIIMIIIALLGGCATVGVSYFASRIATGFARDIRQRVFMKVESFSLREFDTFSTASLITRSTNDVQQIQTVMVMALRIVLMAPILGVGAIIKAYTTASSISWLIAFPVVIMIAVIVSLFALALPRFQVLQKLTDRLNLVTRENLTGLRVIRAFNTESYEEKKFNKANKDLTDVNLFVNRLLTLLQPIMLLIFNLTSVAIIWVGAHQIQSGTLAIGDMIAFMQYALQVIMAFLLLSLVFIIIPRAAVSAKRINEILDTDVAIKDPKDPKHFPDDVKGTVTFTHATFSYPGSDTPVLKDISFSAKPGETTAIIGSTGSGKSTLVNLIPRLYDVTGGEILVDGINVKEVKQADLHQKIGYIPQKGFLFAGTIKSNLLYGDPNATDSLLGEAARVSQAEEFITKLENKYDSTISQGGSNVSGGQKQRLSIARAIVRHPEIYIFDDSFSALDFKTDAALRHALKQETQNAAVIMVTQRISTILNADNIIVLDEGKIVGMGKHHDLLQNCSVYKEIALSQLSQEELDNTDPTLVEGQS